MSDPSGTAKYTIDPRDYRTEGCYLGCLGVWWLIWAPATVFITYLAFKERNAFLYVWLIFGYAGTIVVPVVVLGRNKIQSLEVVGDTLVVCGTGLFPWSRYEMPTASLRAVTLEYYDSGEGESVLTLNLIQNTGWGVGRVMLAQFIHADDKEVLLDEISRFLQGHGLKFEVKNAKAA